MAREKVIFVDFRKGRRPPLTGFGGGPRFVFGVFLTVLVAELLGAAVALGRPTITSAFFAPTAIAVAVAVAVGLDRLIARARLEQRMRSAKRPRTAGVDGADRQGRTLH